MGHAVYSISDPRAQIFKGFVRKISKGERPQRRFCPLFHDRDYGSQIIAGERAIYKGVSANVDFYSGFVYSMLDIPTELFTPMFAIARIVGWSAHRLEEFDSM